MGQAAGGQAYADSCDPPPRRAGPEGEEMSPAETSAYLLMAGGLIWVLVGIAGLVWRRGDGLRTGRDRAEPEETGTDD